MLSFEANCSAYNLFMALSNVFCVCSYFCNIYSVLVALSSIHLDRNVIISFLSMLAIISNVTRLDLCEIS